MPGRGAASLSPVCARHRWKSCFRAGNIRTFADYLLHSVAADQSGRTHEASTGTRRYTPYGGQSRIYERSEAHTLGTRAALPKGGFADHDNRSHYSGLLGSIGARHSQEAKRSSEERG